jgi:hypothetical protein
LLRGVAFFFTRERADVFDFGVGRACDHTCLVSLRAP